MEVLVVDDIAESRHALCALVAELGHVATGADSGAAALDQVVRRPPDLVLLDLLMPDIDGFEITRRIRALSGSRWLPVLVTSALAGDEHFAYALQSGADDYIARPVNSELLQAKLNHYGRVLALQSRLARLAQRQRDILDNILDAVITLDENGHVEELNQAAHALFRDPASAPAPVDDCVSLLGLELQELLGRREVQLRRADGSEFPAEVGMSAWREDGRLRYTVVLRDLTEQRAIERMKDEFVATVSHELRTPLTSVLGALSLLAGGAAGTLPPGALPLADVARRNGERLGRLVDDILDITKLEGDRMVMHLRPQPVAPLLREALAANQGLAAASGVTLQAEGLDEAAGAEARLDADRFQQAMANLLSNAIKHSPRGDAVRVRLDVTPAVVRVTVRDRGRGIDAQFRARLFDKFTQSDGSDRRAEGGTGLGLYITRMLVERMGGHIAADEVVGAGASFSLSFPNTAVAPAAPASAVVVLHVDSDFEMRARLARWLAPLCSVDSAANTEQAAAMAGQRPPSLVIGNPQAQGSADDFCAGLRRLAGGRPVLLYGDSIDARYAAQLGLPWLSPSRTRQADLLGAVQEALAALAAETQA